MNPPAPNEIVICQYRWKTSLYVLMFVIFTALVAFMMSGIDADAQASSKYLIVSWLLMIGFGGCGLAYLISVIWQIPRLTLSGAGLTYQTLYRRHFWKWSEVGPFAIDIQQINLTRTFYVCAMMDDSPDPQLADGPPNQASLANADLKIPLSLMPPGQNGGAAMAFVALLNQWRESNGA